MRPNSPGRRVDLGRGRLGRLREALLPADEESFELLARLHANLGELASVVVEHVLVPRSAVGSVPDRLLRKAELPVPEARLLPLARLLASTSAVGAARVDALDAGVGVPHQRERLRRHRGA